MRQMGRIVGALVLSGSITLAARWVREDTLFVIPTMKVEEAVQAAGTAVRCPGGFGKAIEVFSQTLWDGTEGVVSVTAPVKVSRSHAD